MVIMVIVNLKLLRLSYQCHITITDSIFPKIKARFQVQQRKSMNIRFPHRGIRQYENLNNLYLFVFYGPFPLFQLIIYRVEFR